MVVSPVRWGSDAGRRPARRRYRQASDRFPLRRAFDSGAVRPHHRENSRGKSPWPLRQSSPSSGGSGYSKSSTTKRFCASSRARPFRIGARNTQILSVRDEIERRLLHPRGPHPGEELLRARARVHLFRDRRRPDFRRVLGDRRPAALGLGGGDGGFGRRPDEGGGLRRAAPRGFRSDGAAAPHPHRQGARALRPHLRSDRAQRPRPHLLRACAARRRPAFAKGRA